MAASTVQVDILIKGGVLVSGDGMSAADIAIHGEIIHSIGPDLPVVANQMIDATGRFVLPGIIDVHNHPVYDDRMDTFSISAAFGGVATVVRFVGSFRAWGGPGRSHVDALKAFIDEACKMSIIDFGAHSVFNHDDLQDMDKTIAGGLDLGVISYKIFMCYCRRGMKLEDHEILRVMEIIRDHNGLLMVHAEHGASIDYLIDKYVAEGKTTPEYYLPTRPNLAEAEAVCRASTMASVIGLPMYYVHLSAKEAMEVIRWFKDRGDPVVFAETCPHSLTLTDEEMTKHGALAKGGPPAKASFCRRLRGTGRRSGPRCHGGPLDG